VANGRGSFLCARIRGILPQMPTRALRPPPQPVTLLAADRLRMDDPVDAVVSVDRARRGAVTVRIRPGLIRRAEPGPCGPLIFEATQRGPQVEVQIWGSAATPPSTREHALETARAWVGWYDHVPDLVALTAGHAALQRAARQLGEIRLSRLPRVGEAVGRAVLEQLVQGTEAHRSTAQLVAAIGQPASRNLWCWPTPTALGRTPAHAMRRCGISLRGATALHASALDDPQLERVRTDFATLDRRLRAIRGIGVWTSAQARFALGDPDAVSVGDYNLPDTVCHALAGAAPGTGTDELMLELLEPYQGQRGRVLHLVVRAAGHDLLPRTRRRAPRAALSAHRYW
jgi:3-methyladenine DNA glycosylase/8-oxoguanine DNA glycosylase